MRTNEQIARQLQNTARELSQNRANLYRIRAYRHAANTILGLDRAVEHYAAAGRLDKTRGSGKKGAP